MKGKVRLNQVLHGSLISEAIEAAISEDIKLYAFTSPYKIVGPKKHEIRKYISNTKFSSIELEKEDPLPIDFYELCPKAMQKSTMTEYWRFGLSEKVELLEDTKGFDHWKFYDPFPKIFKTPEAEDCELLINSVYLFENVFIDKSQASRIRVLMGIEEAPSIEQNSKPERTVAKVDLQSSKPNRDYEQTQHGENLRRTHEAIIEFLISEIENDAKNQQLKPYSQLTQLLTEEGKMKNSTLADQIYDKSHFYFGGEKGFGRESLRKRISDTRKVFQ